MGGRRWEQQRLSQRGNFRGPRKHQIAWKRLVTGWLHDQSSGKLLLVLQSCKHMVIALVHEAEDAHVSPVNTHCDMYNNHRGQKSLLPVISDQ